MARAGGRFSDRRLLEYAILLFRFSHGHSSNLVSAPQRPFCPTSNLLAQVFHILIVHPPRAPIQGGRQKPVFVSPTATSSCLGLPQYEKGSGSFTFWLGQIRSWGLRSVPYLRVSVPYGYLRVPEPLPAPTDTYIPCTDAAAAAKSDT